jgi:hypothetical protein
MQTKERVKEIFKEYRALETKRKVFTAAGKSTPELEEFAIVATCGADDSRLLPIKMNHYEPNLYTREPL